MKPLEFKIEKVENPNDLKMIFFYEDGTTDEIYFMFVDKPKGLELNKHYSIADIYGYKVKDDREGL